MGTRGGHRVARGDTGTQGHKGHGHMAMGTWDMGTQARTRGHGTHLAMGTHGDEDMGHKGTGTKMWGQTQTWIHGYGDTDMGMWDMGTQGHMDMGTRTDGYRDTWTWGDIGHKDTGTRGQGQECGDRHGHRHMTMGTRAWGCGIWGHRHRDMRT